MQRKILIVDDVAINRKLLHKILSNEYDILEAENGEEALATLRRTHKQLSAVLLDIVMPVMDGHAVLREMRADPLLSAIPVIVTTGNTGGDAEIKALTLGANDFIAKPYVPEIIKRRLKNTINLRETAATINALQRDKLTGLFNREAFFQNAADMIRARPAGHYVMACFDIDNFKVINDQYGSEKGDDVLRGLAKILKEGFEPVGGLVGRIMADIFAVLYPTSFLNTQALADIRAAASRLDGSLPPISYTIGRYVVDDLSLSVSAMYDRAAIAEASVKGRFDEKIAQYDESMREHILQEQAIVNEMKQALEKRQFEVWFQPQYNHSTGALIGAEALVRWRHPERGLVFPGAFIPVFERNGFIYELDKYVWEEACALLRKWIDAGDNPLPISVNVSRYDVFREDLIETVTGLVNRYGIPIGMLRLEITESAFAKSTDQIINVVRGLIGFGFTMEIDDFGSGYSSLNTLKDVPAQIVKLDMRFLESQTNSDRGGNILESVVRMAKWLGMSVIAEGVETREQADYLKSIGCNYVQGYLYAKPMPAAEYETLALFAGREEKLASLETVENLNNNAFWNPKSMDTLIFNSYVGGACIFEYHNGNIELLRVTDKYAQAIGSAVMTVEDMLRLDWKAHLDAETRVAVDAAIRQSLDTRDEVTGEYVFWNLPGCPEKTYLRSTLRVIASAGSRYLIYCTNENITAQREAEDAKNLAAEQLRAILANIEGGVTTAVVEDGVPRLLYANEQFYEHYGYTREQYEAEVTNPHDLIHEGDRERVASVTREASETNKPYSITYRIVRRDGEIRWQQGNIAMIRMPGIASPVQLAVANDITAQKLAEAKISSLNDSLLNMMNDTPGGFVRLRVLPGDGLEMVYANANYCRLRGMTHDQIMAADPAQVLDVIHPDDRAEVESIIREMIRSGRYGNMHGRLSQAGGGYIPVNVFARVTKNEAGETFVNVYFADLSEQEKRDLSLRETMPFLLSAIMKSTTDSVFAKDRDLRYICCSPAFLRLAGRKDEREIIGKTDHELFAKETADLFHKTDLRLIESGEALLDYIEPIPSCDGTQHYARTSKYLLRDTAGEIIGMYGIGRDITQERNAFEQLRLLANSIPGGLATYEVTPENMRITYFNDGFCNMLGYSREEYAEISATGVTNITLPEDVPAVMLQIEAMLRDDTPLDCTYRIRSRDGTIKWVNGRGVVSERIGDICFVNVALFDVTKAKLAEAAALVHEQEMRLAMSQMGKMICEYDPISRELTVPDAYAAQYGFPSSVMPGVPESVVKLGIVCEESIPRYLGFYDAILRGESGGSVEYRKHRRDGSYHWERGEFSTIFDADGKPAKVIIAVEETTEQYLRFELERNRPLLGEENLIGRALFNLSQGMETLEYFAPSGEPVPIEYRPDVFGGGMKLERLLIDDDERERFRALYDVDTLLQQYAKGRTEFSLEYRRRRPSGDIIWVRDDLRIMAQPGGSDILMFVYCYSIEEEKTLDLINRSLVVNNFDFITRINGRTGGYVMRGNPDRIIDMPTTHGEDIDAVSREMAEKLVHPDDREMTLRNTLLEGIRRNLEIEEPFRFTYRELQSDGSIQYKKLTQYYLDRARDIIIATREDVTALVREEMRKNEQLEAALKAANEESRVKEREAAAQLHAIMNNVDGGMSAATLINGEIGYLYVNDAYYSMFGYTREQFEKELPRGLVDIIHPDDLPMVYDTAEKSVATGRERMEFRVRKRDGEMIWVRSISSSRVIPGIEAPVHIAVLIDITKEREIADTLRMSEEQFRIAASFAGTKIARYDVKTRVYTHRDDVLLGLGFSERIENMPQAFIDRGIIAPECVEAYYDFYDRIARGEKTVALDTAIIVDHGAYLWIHVDATVIFGADGKPSQAVIVFNDITEQREKEAVYKKWQQSLQQRKKESYTLVRCNLSKDTLYDSTEGSLVNTEFSAEATGFDDKTREYASKYVYPKDRDEYLAFLKMDTLLANYHRGTRVKTFEYREMRADQSLRWLRLTIELVEYPNSTDIEAYMMFEDIDESKRDELLNRERAQTDPLTGVLNRVAFSQVVERLIEGPGAVENFALMMLDIDGFKLINDTFGHGMGDQVLVDIAKTLRGTLRHGDTLGRLGGDEFLICLPGMDDDGAIGNKAGQICSLLYRALSMEVYTSASVGIAVYPRDGRDFETLYRKMDTALYAVKAHGKNHYAFFNESMNEKLEDGVSDTESAVTNKRRQRMLVVDDSPMSLAMITEMFEDEFIIETARDGSEALMYVRRYGTSIAVILLDLLMPGMDGFAVLERLRSSAQMRTIPVIVVSVMDEYETSLRTLQSGASDFVTKPINPDLLRLRVQSAISKAENDRLRAQNNILLLTNTEVAKYRTALSSVGMAIIEYDPVNGVFDYDPSLSARIAGNYDERPLWDILREEDVASDADAQALQALVLSVADADAQNHAETEVRLRTHGGEMHRFRASAIRRRVAVDFPERVVLALLDMGEDGA